MKWLQHPLIKVAFTLLSLVFSLSLYSSWKRHQATAQEVKQAEIQVAQLQQQVNQASQEVLSANDSASQEKIIRDELLMQKPGEIVLQIPTVKADEVPLPLPSPSPTNWEKWQKVLF